MFVITDKTGERQVCDRCHRVRVKFRKGKAVCNDCRAELWDEELRNRRRLNRIFGPYYKVTRRKRRKSA